MKKILSLILVFVLCIGFAFAESGNGFWYTDDVSEDGSLIYYFEDLSLTIPSSWFGRFIVKTTDLGVSFYQKASYERYKEDGEEYPGGHLFTLGRSVNSDFENLPSFKYIGFCEKSCFNYFFDLPSDFQPYIDDDIIDEYTAMFADIDWIADHVVFYDDVAGSDSEPVIRDEDEPIEDDSRSIQQVRYHFEHSMLPRYFYEVPDEMLRAIKEEGVFYLWKLLCDENGYDAEYYNADDVVERWYNADDDTVIVQVLLPEPDDNLLCYRVYFVYNEKLGIKAYYTSESDVFTPTAEFICSWNEEREHQNFGTVDLLDAASDDYESGLVEQARMIADLAGVSQQLVLSDSVADSYDNIVCEEQDFSVDVKTGYTTEFEDGTGLYIYVEEQGSIPYAIVYRNEDLLLEPFEFIKEQMTPYMKEQYGDNLVAVNEIEEYAIGGKVLPAGLYSYMIGDILVDMLRVFDSTGDQTIAYTAKYIDGFGEDAVEALDVAMRSFAVID